MSQYNSRRQPIPKDRREMRRDGSRSKDGYRGLPGQGLFRSASLLVTGGALALSAVLGIGLWRTGDRFLAGVTQLFNAPPAEPQVDVRSIVLQQVRGASELTTAIFGMQAVVPTSRDRTVGGYVIGKTTLLYIAYGEVRAGVDLSKLSPQDIEVIGENIRVRLPVPEILDSKIDVTRSEVYDYDRGFLGLGPDSAPELQSLAQRETLKQVVETACSQGILLQANDRATQAVTQLMNTAGFKTIYVETQAPAADACVTDGAIATEQDPGVSPSPAELPSVEPIPSGEPAQPPAPMPNSAL